MHFFNSPFPLGWRLPMYPPKYPFMMLCALCVVSVVRFNVCLRTHLRLQHFSCVDSRMGSLSFGLTSVLLPQNAMQKPGMVPFSHSWFRATSVEPNALRAPLTRKPLSLANPLQIRSGLPKFKRLVQGASCLHSFGHLLL